MDASEESALKSDEVNKIVEQAAETILKGKMYTDDSVAQWVNLICEKCVEDLYALKKPFKYVVTCVLQQRNGAGIHTATSCFWDTGSDESHCVTWPKTNSREPNQGSVACIVTVFASGFHPS